MNAMTKGSAAVALLLAGGVAAAAPPAGLAPDAGVGRAQFPTAIVDREPVDRVVVLQAPLDTVYFFTELRHLEGRTVIHRWEYRGEVQSQVSFQVKGPRWRVFSKKRIKPGQVGEWSVTVLDSSGWPLAVELFRYEPAP